MCRPVTGLVFGLTGDCDPQQDEDSPYQEGEGGKAEENARCFFFRNDCAENRCCGGNGD
jgi:hypothetical protein